MAFRPIGPEKTGTSNSSPQSPNSAPFDPKQLTVKKPVLERSEAEKDLSQRLMRAQLSPPAHSTAQQSAAGPAGKRPPLGMPAGSVRALLCLIIVAFLVIQTARGVRVDVVWS
jgi:hypothetical protein